MSMFNTEEICMDCKAAEEILLVVNPLCSFGGMWRCTALGSWFTRTRQNVCVVHQFGAAIGVAVLECRSSIVGLSLPTPPGWPRRSSANCAKRLAQADRS